MHKEIAEMKRKRKEKEDEEWRLRQRLEYQQFISKLKNKEEKPFVSSKKLWNDREHNKFI